MNDAFETLKTAFLLLVGITVGILAYLGRRTSERVDELKENAVTRKELGDVLDRLETRQNAQHSENRDFLERIETKIDANEERASRTRHDTNESVHALAMQVAVLTNERRKQ